MEIIDTILSFLRWRKNEDDDYDGFQYPRRNPRKINYGKSTITVAGGEAAPYEVFIGNTNPASTEDRSLLNI